MLDKIKTFVDENKTVVYSVLGLIGAILLYRKLKK